MYKTTFQSLEVVNEAITALSTRKRELIDLWDRMETNCPYPDEKCRIMEKIEAINSAIHSLEESEVYLPHLEAPKCEIEPEVPIQIL